MAQLRFATYGELALMMYGLSATMVSFLGGKVLRGPQSTVPLRTLSTRFMARRRPMCGQWVPLGRSCTGTEAIGPPASAGPRLPCIRFGLFSQVTPGRSAQGGWF